MSALTPIPSAHRPQFAVMREDPTLELELLARHPCRALLLVASGGCTALALRSALPEARITLVDPNPLQHAHVDAKIEALRTLRGEALAHAFGVGVERADSLSEGGNFEALFRGLRGFVHDFVLSRDRWLQVFDASCDSAVLDPAAKATLLEAAFANPYWPVAFQLFFSDALLNTLFGPDATQHATPGSYPGYFQGRLERGLLRADAGNNPFLQHIFLGQYVDRPESLPYFLRHPPVAPVFERVQGVLADVPNLSEYDFVNLSNILDWTAPTVVEELCHTLSAALRPGAVVMWRQLNNTQNIEQRFGAAFRFDAPLGAALQARDQSLFYSSVHVGVRA